MASTPRVVGDFRAKLGSCGIVGAVDGRLALVDISDQSLVVLDPSTAAVVRAPLPTTPGCVLRSKKGGLLVALTVDDAAKQPGGRIYGVAAPPAADAAWTPEPGASAPQSCIHTRRWNFTIMGYSVRVPAWRATLGASWRCSKPTATPTPLSLSSSVTEATGGRSLS